MLSLSNAAKSLAKTAKIFYKAHGAQIFTGSGIVGLVVTIGLTIVETIRFKDEFDSLENPERGEVIKLAARHYWPVLLSGAATGGCFLKANDIHIAKEAALTIVAQTAQTELSDLKSQITQELGAKKLQKFEHQATEQRIQRETPSYSDSDITETGTGFTEFEDPWTGKRFRASVDHIRHVWDDKIVPRLCDGDDVSYFDFVHEIREYDDRHKIPKFTEYLGFKGARNGNYKPPTLYFDSVFKDYEHARTIASIQFSEAPVWSIEKEVYIN